MVLAAGIEPARGLRPNGQRGFEWIAGFFRTETQKRLGTSVGAIASLPLVASYGVIEEIWLGRYVNRKTAI